MVVFNLTRKFRVWAATDASRAGQRCGRSQSHFGGCRARGIASRVLLMRHRFFLGRRQDPCARRRGDCRELDGARARSRPRDRARAGQVSRDRATAEFDSVPRFAIRGHHRCIGGRRDPSRDDRSPGRNPDGHDDARHGRARCAARAPTIPGPRSNQSCS